MQIIYNDSRQREAVAVTSAKELLPLSCHGVSENGNQSIIEIVELACAHRHGAAAMASCAASIISMARLRDGQLSL